MAKKQGTKKPKNTLKKIDINNWNLQAIEDRGLSAATLRKRYSEFRSIAEKRKKALEAKGYAKVAEVTEAYFPTLKEIHLTTPDPELYVKLKMKELVEYLNNPLTLLSNQKNRKELKALETLRKHDREFAANRYASFSKFMEAVRARGLGLLEDSDRAVVFFETHWEKGMSMEDLSKAFEDWEKEEHSTQIANLQALYYKPSKEDSKEEADRKRKEFFDLVKEKIENVDDKEIERTLQFIKNRRSRDRKI